MRISILLALTLITSTAMADNYTQSYSPSGRPTVHVHVDDGDIRVITSDSTQVEFRVNYKGYTLDRNLSIDSRQEGDSVELNVRVKHMSLALGQSLRQRLEAEVYMPRNADLEIHTDDGNVDVSEVDGKVSVRSGDGKLKVANLSGTVDLQTGDGSIDAMTLKGTIRLRTGDGTIKASAIDGRCEATSADGSVQLSGRFDGLDVRSGDGSVTARAEPGSTLTDRWSIRTSDGGIDLGIPKDLKANLDASTGDGRITLGLPVTLEGRVSSSRVEGPLNGGGQPLVIRTSDGSIRLNGT